MDASVIQEVANVVWPLVGTGAAERAGAAATDEALGLLERIRLRRRERGLAADPASRDELVEELQKLPPDDRRVFNVIVNTYNGTVIAETVESGIRMG